MNAKPWLEYALAALEQGQSPEDILARVPEPWRAEVRAALEAAQWMRQEAAPTLHQAATRWTPPPPPPISVATSAPAWFRWLPRLVPRVAPRLVWAVALALVTILGTWGVARAAYTALPGQWAYPLRQAWENVRWSWSASPDARLNLALHWAEDRLEQARRAAARGQSVTLRAALEEYARQLQRGYRQWWVLPAPQRAARADAVRQRLHAQGQTLQALATAPEIQTPAGRAAWQYAHRAWQTFWQALLHELTPTATQAATQAAPTATSGSPSRPIRSQSAPANTPTPTAALKTTPTPAPEPEATPTPTDGAASSDTCVQRGRGRGHNQCVPDDQGRGNDDGNPADSGSSPPAPIEPPSGGASSGDTPGDGPPEEPPGRRP